MRTKQKQVAKGVPKPTGSRGAGSKRGRGNTGEGGENRPEGAQAQRQQKKRQVTFAVPRAKAPAAKGAASAAPAAPKIKPPAAEAPRVPPIFVHHARQPARQPAQQPAARGMSINTLNSLHAQALIPKYQDLKEKKEALEAALAIFHAQVEGGKKQLEKEVCSKRMWREEAKRWKRKYEALVKAVNAARNTAVPPRQAAPAAAAAAAAPAAPAAPSAARASKTPQPQKGAAATSGGEGTAPQPRPVNRAMSSTPDNWGQGFRFTPPDGEDNGDNGSL